MFRKQPVHSNKDCVNSDVYNNNKNIDDNGLAGQEQVVRKNLLKAKTFKTQQDSECKVCGKSR